MQVLAEKMARCLRDTGCLVVRDTRVKSEDNETFLNLMEKYFEQPDDVKMADARPECHYQVWQSAGPILHTGSQQGWSNWAWLSQVGVTPEGVEMPRCAMDPQCVASVNQQPPEHRATLPTGPDPKWRYFWRIGDRPAATEFAELNAEPVVPAGKARLTEMPFVVQWQVPRISRCFHSRERFHMQGFQNGRKS